MLITGAKGVYWNMRRARAIPKIYQISMNCPIELGKKKELERSRFNVLVFHFHRLGSLCSSQGMAVG